MSVQKKYEHYNSERNVELREWCSKNRGRSTLIDMRVFGYNLYELMVRWYILDHQFIQIIIKME